MATTVGDDTVRALCSASQARFIGGPAAASVGNDGMLRTWSSSGDTIRAVRGSDSYLLCVAASTDSHQLGVQFFTGAADGVIRRWSAGLAPLQSINTHGMADPQSLVCAVCRTGDSLRFLTPRCEYGREVIKTVRRK